MNSSTAASDLVRRLRGEFRVMVKDPVFAIYNHEPVTAARETAYVVRALDAMIAFNRRSTASLELIAEARELATQETP